MLKGRPHILLFMFSDKPSETRCPWSSRALRGMKKYTGDFVFGLEIDNLCKQLLGSPSANSCIRLWLKVTKTFFYCLSVAHCCLGFFFFLLNDLMVSNFSCDKAAGPEKKLDLNCTALKTKQTVTFHIIFTKNSAFLQRKPIGNC